MERAPRGYRGRFAPPEWVAADIDRIEKRYRPEMREGAGE